MRLALRTTLALSLTVTLAAGLAGTAGAATDSTPAPATTATRVTPTTFGFGVQAGLDAKGLGGWTARAAVPWDYTYRYLGGTAGTTKSWTNLAPQASYPITYAQAASAQGFTPVFSYYQMLAGTTPCTGCGEAQQDFANLNNPTQMLAYLTDFRLLMERLGTGTYDGVSGYGGDTIVQIEPDLAGYAQLATLGATTCYGYCTGTGNDPALLKSSVASSGFGPAAGLPDTFQGFNEVLLRLRDAYAPNVRLAVHVDNWGTGYEINGSTLATLDATALGSRAGTFAARSGATSTHLTHSAFDLMFNDVSNKDAAYYTYVLHKPRFWDQDNQVFPNFHRWEDYMRAATSAAGLKAIVWQVPIGNQLYAAENNTYGHWQDNRVEYFFNHVAELRDAGIVGVLFGTTQLNATSNADMTGDGVTNPAPICNSDGWSSGKVVCSSIQSPAADDDGAYLRVRAKAYYQAPLAVS